MVTLQFVDLPKITKLDDLPHDAWLDEVIAVDEKGDVVGRSYSLAGLRHNIRRLQAEARRNEYRRVWRKQLAELEDSFQELIKQRKPIDRLQTLLSEAQHLVESGIDSLRQAAEHDTVVRAIREIEKEIERVTTIDTDEVLFSDLLGGLIKHPDLRYNELLLQKLHVYEFRSGGAYTAPTPKDVAAHYREKLAGLTNHDQVRLTNLKLPDDEPTILEFVREGTLELAPDTVPVQGNKGQANYKVDYGYAKVDGESVPAGIIVVSEAAYERNGAQYGRASRFPTLPYGITLLIRVRVKVQDNETLSDPCPDGKALQNEVLRCRARLKNPREMEVSYYETSTYLCAWPSW